jgi:hypothetical protein
MGSTLVAFLGALHYWFPKFTGRMYPESLARMCSLGVFFGFNLTFMPQFVMGARGMPRRYWDYDPQFQIFHQLSTIGAFVLGISIFISVIALVMSLKNGKLAPRNPWGGSSLEWQAPTPPPLYNFEKPPVLHELYNYDDLYEVAPDVWERRTPIETTDARADELARNTGTAAEHAVATRREKADAMVHSKAEEVRAEHSITEKSQGKPLTSVSEDIKDAEKVAGAGDIAPTEAAEAEATVTKSDDEEKKS